MHRFAHATRASATPVAAPAWHAISAHPEVRHILRGARVQPKLRVGAPNDPAEREADRSADEVMRMREPQARSTCSCNGECPKCPPKQTLSEPSRLQTRHLQAGETEQAAVPPIVHEVLRTPGQPLDTAMRSLMEPRLGHDFGNVRMHTDQLAARSAAAVAAQAYTVGSDVVFGAGRYAPASRYGQRLLAHELAHVVQQHEPEVRRMTLGTGKAPHKLREIPDQERPRVLGAIARVRKVAKDREGYANCHKSYAKTCPAGNASSLENAFDAAVLWRVPPGQRLGAGATTFCNKPEGAAEWDRRTVGYSDTGYAGGEATLSFDLLHELGHVCGISCPDIPHYLADKLAMYCMGPLERDQDNPLSFRFGRSTEDWAAILSYGWLLHERRAGRLSLRLNADFNILGALRGLQEASGEQAPAGEIGGATFDLRLRPFSGEHFGGLSFHAGLGGQFGRFRIRPPTADDPADIRSDAALVVEVGNRIEWWVKNEEATTASGEIGRVKPRAIDLSYRMIQPATTGARRVHEFLTSYVYHF